MLLSLAGPVYSLEIGNPWGPGHQVQAVRAVHKIWLCAQEQHWPCPAQPLGPCSQQIPKPPGGALMIAGLSCMNFLIPTSGVFGSFPRPLATGRSRLRGLAGGLKCSCCACICGVAMWPGCTRGGGQRTKIQGAVFSPAQKWLPNWACALCGTALPIICQEWQAWGCRSCAGEPPGLARGSWLCNPRHPGPLKGRPLRGPLKASTLYCVFISAAPGPPFHLPSSPPHQPAMPAVPCSMLMGSLLS